MCPEKDRREGCHATKTERACLLLFRLDVPDVSTSAVISDWEVAPTGRARVVLRGRLDAQSTGGCWRELERRLCDVKLSALEVDVHDQTVFIGRVLRVLPGMLIRPRQLRGSEIKSVFETSGVNALPVVVLFSGLVGLVLALEAAHPLEQFGARLFAADMIGFATVRDTGPLVTAIMLAGRSSSAFAAELGTMKVNQELDALTTMGLDPIRFLVVEGILGTLLLAAMVVFGSSRFFEGRMIEETYVDGSVEGLREGAPVLLRGVPVGEVRRINVSWNVYGRPEPQYVVVEFAVRPSVSVVPPGRVSCSKSRSK